MSLNSRSAFHPLILGATACLTAFLQGCGGGGSDAVNTSYVSTPSSNATAASLTMRTELPSFNADGTCISDLAGVRVNLGSSSGQYTHRTNVPVSSMACTPSGEVNVCGNVQQCTYVTEGVEQGTWYVALQAYDYSGNYSATSEELVGYVY